MTRLILKIVAVGLVALSPALVFAAATDVTLTTDAVISVGGDNYNISGSSALVESLTVNSANFEFVLQAGSSIEVRSDDRRILSHNGDANYVDLSECTSDFSRIKFSSNAGDTNPVTIRVTPETGPCGGSATAATSIGGGGSVLGISGTPITAPQQAGSISPLVGEPLTAPTIPASVSAVFQRDLELGMGGEDVKRLQILLNTDAQTQVALSGVGSPGKETTYFGSLTQKAVQRFQVKYGIVSLGGVGYGRVGPKTRAKLLEVFGASAPAAPAEAVTVNFTKPLYLSLSDPQVKLLQQVLNTDPDTQVASSGVGSSGQETNFFGRLTEAAVQRFQLKYGLAKSGDPGWGFVGPKTRAKLNELFGAQISQPAAPAQVLGVQTQDQKRVELETQLNSMIETLTELQRKLREIKTQ